MTGGELNGDAGKDNLTFSSPLILQSEWFRRVKETVGWRVVSREPSFLQRTVGPFSLVYGPHAFGLEDTPPGLSLEQIVPLVRNIGMRSGATVVRWDVPWSRERFPEDAARSAGMRRAPVRVQPPDTVIVPLGDEDTMMGAMKSKTRYNVRLATRKGVVVEMVTGTAVLEALPDWYRLYRETAVRDAISIHPESYYRSVLKIAVDMAGSGEEAPVFTLYTARHEGDYLGGIIVASWKGVSTYLYGASSNVKRNLMASYALQWEAMRRAAAAGDTSYDMFGIPPTDDPRHSMHGLYRFKTGFGGTILHRAGAWDLPIRPVPAAIYRSIERLRGWYHFTLRKGMPRLGGGRGGS